MSAEAQNHLPPVCDLCHRGPSGQSNEGGRRVASHPVRSLDPSASGKPAIQISSGVGLCLAIGESCRNAGSEHAFRWQIGASLVFHRKSAGVDTDPGCDPWPHAVEFPVHSCYGLLHQRRLGRFERDAFHSCRSRQHAQILAQRRHERLLAQGICNRTAYRLE